MARVLFLGALLGLMGGFADERCAAAEAPCVATLAFGAPGQIAGNVDLETGLGPFTHDFPDVGTRSRSIRPGVDVFVIRNFSISVEALYGVEDKATTLFTETYAGRVLYTRRPLDTTRTTYGASLRVGNNVPLGRLFSFWPRLGVGLSTTSVQLEHVTVVLDPNAPPNFDYNETAVFADIALPLLVHIAPHFYASFGFNVRADLSARPVRGFGFGVVGEDGSSRTNLLVSLA